MAFIFCGDPTCRKKDSSPFERVLFTDLEECANQRKYDVVKWKPDRRFYIPPVERRKQKKKI